MGTRPMMMTATIIFSTLIALWGGMPRRTA
jgi:hypothetical protein